MKTTLSNFSRNPRDLLMAFLADGAPCGTETAGHVRPIAWVTDMASISPSVMTTNFPPSRHRCWPNSGSDGLMSPKKAQSLPGRSGERCGGKEGVSACIYWGGGSDE